MKRQAIDCSPFSISVNLTAISLHYEEGKKRAESETCSGNECTALAPCLFRSVVIYKMAAAIGETDFKMRNVLFVVCWLAMVSAMKVARADSIDWPTLSFNQVVTNTFSLPTSITHAGDGSQRLFIEEQKGRIRIIQDGNVLSEPFLDISNRVLSVGPEQGLLGLAFPPGYATNAHFYVDYTRRPDGATVISQFSVTGDPNVADPSSERVLLAIPQTNDFHNGGQIAFGPDGYLYIGKGDGGPQGDPQNHAQDAKGLLGKLLRIDVENGATTYRVPTNNPFVGKANYAPEIWAVGLRNPWRFSFDRLTGDLYIGDVGQNLYEEVDVQPGTSSGGQNYGWRIMEAWTNYVVPAGLTNLSALTLPVTWYGHPVDVGGSITGGYVYRGPSQARLNGIYFFGDFEAGWIGGLKRAGTNWQRLNLFRSEPRWHFSTFGEDEQGELYVANYYPGVIYRIQDAHKVWMPVFEAGYLYGSSNAFAYSNTVNITCATPNAAVHYSTNGDDPTESDPVVPASGYIPIVNGTTYKAKAFRGDLTPSDIATAILTLKVARPKFSRGNTYITNNTPVTISTATPGAEIYYTGNSYLPLSAWDLYSSEILVSGRVDLYAIGVASGYQNSDWAAVNFYPAQAAALNVWPPSGAYSGTFEVTMACSTPAATIHYTLDDSSPTTNSPVYTGPISITGRVAIRAYASANGYVDAPPVRAFYGLADYKYPTVVTTFAGDGQFGTNNGFGPSARFSFPVGVCLDRVGNLYVADTANNMIRKITPQCVVTRFAGTGLEGYKNGARLSARFSRPLGICADRAGNIYVADAGNYRIRKIDRSGNVSTFAGSGRASLEDGIGTAASFENLHFIEFDRQTNLFVGDEGRVRKITRNKTVSTVATNGPSNNWGYTSALGVCVDLSNNVYLVTEEGRYPEGGRTYQITPAGSQSLFAGSSGGESWYYSDGPRLEALFRSYFDGYGIGYDATADAQGNIYVSDITAIRKIDRNGWVSTFAGSYRGFANGTGQIAEFLRLSGLCVDTNGNVFVADSGNNCIRKISPDTANIGIADDWQLAHFGHIGIDPGADPDHDGQSNFAEFWAGTDPLNSTSRFEISNVTLLSNNVSKITWQSVTGKSYAVMYSTNLADWITLTNSFLATNSTASFTDSTPPARDAQRFYRVSVNF
jgi:hypothetical protein